MSITFTIRKRNPIILGCGVALALLLSILAVTLLVDRQSPSVPEATFVANVEDCKVWAVPQGGRKVYVSICPERSAVSWVNEDGVVEHTMIEKSVDRP